MIFRKNTKNDLPREGKKLVFLRFLGWNTRFPRENNAISPICFHGVSLFRLGLILGVFWGLLGAPLGARWHPSGPQLGHLAASWVSWVASWEPWGALWDQFGLQLGDFVPSWKPCDANLGISWVTLSPLGSDLASFGYLVCESSFLPYLWMPLVEFVGIGQAGLDLGWFTFCMVEYFVEDIFDNLLLKCSWQRWYVCRACIGSELLYFCTRSCFFDVVLGFLQVYTINQKYQRDLMYVLQSYVVEPASVRSESNSFFSSLLQHAHTSTCTGAFLSIVPFAW